MKTEITKIKLQLKGRDIELTATEAREVQQELNRLFEIEKTELQKFKEQWEKENPKQPYVPSWPTPIIIERERVPYWPRPWEIWCGGTTGGITDTGNHPGATLCIAVGQVS
jgi:hypothetical protein